MKQKQVVCSLVSIIYRCPSTCAHNKNKLYKTINCWFRHVHNSDFLGKSLDILSSFSLLHILHMVFQQKCFSDYILLVYQISLSGCFYFLNVLGNISVVSVCFPGCVISFEINLIKSFFYITKKSRQKLKYLENEKSFCEIKSIFHHF